MAERFGNGQILHDVIAIDYWYNDTPVKPRLHFLTHLHADHTHGLGRLWNWPIYTSEANCKLAKHFIRVDPALLVPLELGKDNVLPLGEDETDPKVVVTLLDANHVPGAVMIFIKAFFGNVLYTGDFRFSKTMLDTEPIKTIVDREDLDVLYLDNTFFHKTCNFGPRKSVSDRVISFVKSHPQHHIYIGIRKLGKEAILVDLAKALGERVCVSADKLAVLESLDMPDVFTTRSDESRLHVVGQNLVRRGFIEAENLKRPTLGIILTALFYGWPDGPYSSSAEDRLVHVFEYSDHSSYDELIEFVRLLRPKVVRPLLTSTSASGILRERPEFHESRVDFSPFDEFLSAIPAKCFNPPKFKFSLNFARVSEVSKKRKLSLHVPKERVYRGPKGPVYDSSTSPSEKSKSRQMSDKSDTKSVESASDPGELFASSTKAKSLAKKLKICAGELDHCASKQTVRQIERYLEELEQNF